MSAEKPLVIKAKGGLGNRMLSAVTGIVLAQLNNRTPYIDWRDGMYLAPGENLYPYLFEADWMGDLARFDDAQQVAPAIWSGRITEHPVDIIHRAYPNSHSDPLIYRKLSITLTGPDPAEPVGVFWSYLPKLMRLQPRMARHPDFMGRDLSDITSDTLDRYFRPVSAVRERVDAIFRGLDQPVIGVHIRFTDRKVPLPKIISSLAKLKSDMPKARIFLATDSAQAQAAILSRFPDTQTIDKALAADGAALHVTGSSFSDPVAEARNALIDMIALSRCDWLLHSQHSTFSVTAALIGRIPRARQIDVDRFNAKVVVKRFIQARA